MTTRTITAYEHTCFRCGHTWQTLLKRPKSCLKCKNKDWDRPAAKGRGRPRTLPDELRNDPTRYNREAKRRSRAKINQENANTSTE